MFFVALRSLILFLSLHNLLHLRIYHHLFDHRYKLLEWNADNKACRKTSLAPSFGGPLAQLLPLVPERPPPPEKSPPLDAQVLKRRAKAQPLAAYACAERVVGLVKM